MQCIRRGDYQQACDILISLPPQEWTTNTLGVCAMRCGRIEPAVQVFRGLLLRPNTTVIRVDANDILRVNYATALLLRGLPSGALAALDELKDPHRPTAIRLKQAVRRWAASLPFWRRWDWKLSRIDPPNSSIPIDFEPGEFHFAVETHRPLTPVDPKPASPKLAA